MSGLARQQEDFQAYLLHHQQRIREHVTGTDRASAEERLSVYRNAYRLRLLEALHTDFPVLHALAGDAAFEQIGHAYIDAHPSAHPSLRWFGRHLSDHLRRAQPYAEQPVLADMAAFEWAQGEVFDAPDDAQVSVDAIAAIPPETWPTMRLILHPSVRRLNLAWNVPAMWRAIDRKESPPAAARADQVTPWLLWRSQLEIHWRSLGAEEAWALDACMSATRFGELCEGLCRFVGESDAAMHAAGLLKRWVTDGLVARVDAE